MSAAPFAPDWPEHWVAADVRRDGVTIRQAGEAWVISDPRAVSLPEIKHCPCCGAALTSARTARLVCDFIYPIRDEVRP